MLYTSNLHNVLCQLYPVKGNFITKSPNIKKERKEKRKFLETCNRVTEQERQLGHGCQQPCSTVLPI